MLNIRGVTAVALSSALTAYENGYAPLPEAIAEIRLAHSLLTLGEPTADELRPFLGHRWEVRRGRRQRSPDRNLVTKAEYQDAQVRALAVRLNLPEGFVAARVRPIGDRT
jgi:hypothetical protein